MPHLDKPGGPFHLPGAQSHTLLETESEFKSLVKLEAKVALPQDKPLFA